MPVNIKNIKVGPLSLQKWQKAKAPKGASRLAASNSEQLKKCGDPHMCDKGILPAVSNIQQAAGEEEQERRQKPPPRPSHPRKRPEPKPTQASRSEGTQHAGLGATRGLGETRNTVTRAKGEGGEGPGEAKRGASACRERAGR